MKMSLDPHERAPEYLRTVFKGYRARSVQDIRSDGRVVDPTRHQTGLVQLGACSPGREAVKHSIESLIRAVGNEDDGLSCSHLMPQPMADDSDHIQAYEVTEVPGLIIYPNLLPLLVQKSLLKVLFHRDLCNPAHQTNVHLHHDIQYPENDQSFFECMPLDHVIAFPKHPTMHKPLTVHQFLNKKLRWMTLGGQYDWTKKVYPDSKPPGFPQDIARLLQALFPDTTPEAAIVNLYSPGDTLSMHRDVSEEGDQPLISVSIGCDALFLVGLDPELTNQSGKHAVIRLKSGDAVYMTGQSRYAWHGVPAILRDTCPAELRNWPFEHTGSAEQEQQPRYEHWRGWLAEKRINLNVRQMTDHAPNLE